MKGHYFNAFVGGTSGVFKGVFAQEKCNLVIKNLDSLKNVTNKNPVTTMSWSDDHEEEILIGYGSQLVKVFDLKSRTFTSHELKFGEGPIVGVSKYKGVFVTGVESGAVKVWNEDGSAQVLQTGSHMARMKQSEVERHIAATGGNENDLKLWDLQAGKQIFCAKNVRHDSLEMRVPVWVTDICFMRETKRVAVTTRHGHVRLYDPNSSARRPVVNVTVPEQALISMSTCFKDHHVVVGSTTGQMNLVDLRSKGLVMNKYKGFTGAIKDIACPGEEPYIVSVSADRNLRIHHLSTKEMLFKEYVQSKMSCVLVRKDFRLSYDWEEWEEMADVIKDEKEEESDSKKESSSSDEEAPVVPATPPSRQAKHTRKKHKPN